MHTHCIMHALFTLYHGYNITLHNVHPFSCKNTPQPAAAVRRTSLASLSLHRATQVYTIYLAQLYIYTHTQLYIYIYIYVSLASIATQVFNTERPGAAAARGAQLAGAQGGGHAADRARGRGAAAAAAPTAPDQGVRRCGETVIEMRPPRLVAGGGT
jgi:hypothetical protein